MAQGRRSARAEALSTRDTNHPWGVPILSGALLATGYGLTKFGAPNYEITALNVTEVVTIGVVVALLTYLLTQGTRQEANIVPA